MSKPVTKSEELKERVVKEALTNLHWANFKSHLDEVTLDQDDASAIVALLSRSSDFLIKRPNLMRVAKRVSFVASLEKHLEDKVGLETANSLSKAMATITQIEAGYAEILRTLDGTVAAKLLPEAQASAALQRAAFSYHELEENIRAEMQRRTELTVQSFRITGSDGTTSSPDGVLTGINAALAMTLLLLGHRYKWFDDNKYLELPVLTQATDDEVYKAGLTEALALSWRNWERMEQRCRYFEGELNFLSGDNIPDWAPEKTETVVEYDHLSELELYDHLANQRLNDRMVQTFQEMSLMTDMDAKVAGIANPLTLPPAAFVSAQESHAGVSLSEMLGYSIVDDKETPGGLRLIEWVRGYAVLQQLAKERYDADGKSGLNFVLPRTKLVATLQQLGLENGAADRFVDLASLKMSSRDLFDQPLIRMQDGQLMLFGPGVLAADPGRVTLSAIGNMNKQLSRKGTTFEKEILQFFQDENFNATKLKFKQDGEEYEYDILVEWDDYVFIFECKNRTLSGHNPVAAYYFALEMDSARKQVCRQADGLFTYADTVRERTGIDIAGKTIVPCILNSLPYAARLEDDGVYMSDASSLKRFFQDRYFHLVRPHRLKKKATVLHRTAMKSLWSGEKPTVADFLAYLADPFPLQIAEAHTQSSRHGFSMGERTIVAVADFAYREITTESISDLCGVDPKAVRDDARQITRALSDAARRHERRSITEVERTWRRRHRRPPTTEKL